MKEILTKELLSIVLKIRIKGVITDIQTIKECVRNDAKDSEIAIFIEGSSWNLKNIHELAYICKKWALDNTTPKENEQILCLVEPIDIFNVCKMVLVQKAYNEKDK